MLEVLARLQTGRDDVINRGCDDGDSALAVHSVEKFFLIRRWLFPGPFNFDRKEPAALLHADNIRDPFFRRPKEPARVPFGLGDDKRARVVSPYEMSSGAEVLKYRGLNIRFGWRRNRKIHAAILASPA